MSYIYKIKKKLLDAKSTNSCSKILLIITTNNQEAVKSGIKRSYRRAALWNVHLEINSLQLLSI